MANQFKKHYEERKNEFEWQPGDLQQVTNEQLPCKNCVYRTKHVIRCNGFVVQKPLSVFDEGVCPKYLQSIDEPE